MHLGATGSVTVRLAEVAHGHFSRGLLAGDLAQTSGAKVPTKGSLFRHRGCRFSRTPCPEKSSLCSPRSTELERRRLSLQEPELAENTLFPTQETPRPPLFPLVACSHVELVLHCCDQSSTSHPSGRPLMESDGTPTCSPKLRHSNSVCRKGSAGGSTRKKMPRANTGESRTQKYQQTRKEPVLGHPGPLGPRTDAERAKRSGPQLQSSPSQRERPARFGNVLK